MLITFSIWQGLTIDNWLNFEKMKQVPDDLLFHNNDDHTRLNSKVYCYRYGNTFEEPIINIGF